MKLAFVVPRYGRQIRGGAENAAREMATRLARDREWSVEVLTTTALDSATWQEVVGAGTSEEDGVKVHRFACRSGRDAGFDDYSAPILTRPEQATEEESRRWIEMQGPVSPDLLDAVAETDADLLAFYPYLYHPTVAGIRRAARPSVLHPAAHDEPAIRLPVFRGVFERAAGLVLHTRTERDLVQALFPLAGRPQIVLGLGIDAPPEPGAELLPGLDGRPFLLCLGRVDDQKGTGALWRFFLAYKRRRPGPLALVLAGPVIDAPPADPDLIVPGAVSEAVKWSLLSQALVMVSPSPFESFSLVVAESWAAGTPVLVNSLCAATVENVSRSGGGLRFGGYAEFETALDRLSADQRLRVLLAERGKAFVEANFSWPVVLERYRAFLLSTLGRHPEGSDR